jgi:tetratricopeptide (TPR) repeat protein
MHTRIYQVQVRRLATFWLAGLGIAAGSLLAQGHAPTAAPSSGTSTPNIGSTSNPNGNAGATPGLGTSRNTPNSNINGPLSNQSIFLSGKVMFDDGSSPNPDVRIERICAGRTRLEGHVDSKGRFSIQLGQNGEVDAEAGDATSNSGFGTRGGGMPNSISSSNGARSSGLNSSLWSCELRASYPGYRSDTVELGSRRALDDPNVGTIILHRLANVKGSTISLTTAQAPKPALKNFEKGEQLAEKGKLEDAEKHLLEATSVYPKFAAAWFALGQVEQREDKPADARKAYLAAIDADAKYVSPYNQLALLAGQDGKWEDSAAYSKQALDLNPVEFPSAFWYNAIANYNLRKTDDAAKSAQALVKMDTEHRYPEAENLLAQVALEKHDYADAATHLRAYLALVPNAKNADALKSQLLKMDEASAAAKK